MVLKNTFLIMKVLLNEISAWHLLYMNCAKKIFFLR